MTDDSPDLDELLGLMAKEGGLQPDPDPEEHPGSGALHAYHEGKLTAEKRSRVEEHLSICGRCRDLLVDYRQFRIAAERKKTGKTVALKWAAGILLGLVGLSVYLASRPEPPLGKEDTTTLSARGSLKSRGSQDQAFKLPERILLENPTPDTYPQYQVRILDSRGRPAQVFEGLQETDYKIGVLLEKDSLPPGDYEAALSAVENGARRNLGSFGFRVLPAD